MLKALLSFFFFTILSGLYHGLRLLLSKPFRQRPDTRDVTFYSGDVVHSRNAPKKHYFTYPVRYIIVDLPEAGEVPSAYAAEQLAAGDRLSAAAARQLSGCNGPVRALLMPASGGYEQNPICVYYCYDSEDDRSEASGGGGDRLGALRCCIAEVTNTPWGDRVAFPFNPRGDSTPKPLHVSPLQDMRSAWSLNAHAPADTLHVRVDVTSHPELGGFFVAILDARAETVVEDPLLWGFGMAHWTAGWIYWHALVLLTRKRLSFFGHPKSSGEGTDYREAPVSMAGAQGWRACPVVAAGKKPPLRPYVWTDATQYPWT